MEKSKKKYKQNAETNAMPIKLNETIIARGQIVESDRSKLPKGVLCRGVWPTANINLTNQNNRLYERAVFEKSIFNNKDIQEKMRNRVLFGHAEHPNRSQSDLQLTSHVITKTFIGKADRNEAAARGIPEGTEVVYQEFDIFDTPCGRIINTLLEAGCALGVSTRAEGDLEERIDPKTKQRYYRVIPESYRYITTDFTADPSTLGTRPVSIIRELKSELESPELTNEERVFAEAILESVQKIGASASSDSEAKEIGETKESDTEGSGKSQNEWRVSVEFDNGSQIIAGGPGPAPATPTQQELEDFAKEAAAAEAELGGKEAEAEAETKPETEAGAEAEVKAEAEAEAESEVEGGFIPPAESQHKEEGDETETEIEAEEEEISPESIHKEGEIGEPEEEEEEEEEEDFEEEEEEEEEDEEEEELEESVSALLQDAEILESIQQLAYEAFLPALERNAVLKAIDSGLIGNKFPPESEMRDALKSVSELKDVDLAEADIKELYLKHILAPKAIALLKEKGLSDEEIAKPFKPAAAAVDTGTEKGPRFKPGDEQEVLKAFVKVIMNSAIAGNKNSRANMEMLFGASWDTIEKVIQSELMPKEQLIKMAANRLRRYLLESKSCQILCETSLNDRKKIIYAIMNMVCKKALDGDKKAQQILVNSLNMQWSEIEKGLKALQTAGGNAGGAKPAGQPVPAAATKVRSLLTKIALRTLNAITPFLHESAGVKSLYRKRGLTPPKGKGIHTKKFHDLATKIAKGYKERGDSEKEAKKKAYATAMKILGKKKAVKAGHRRSRNESFDADDSLDAYREIKKWRLREAVQRAESQKLAEEMEALQNGAMVESRYYIAKINEIKEQWHKEVADISALLARETERARKLESRLTEVENLLENKINETAARVQKKAVQEYLQAKLQSTSLPLTDGYRALLENCSTMKEVDMLLETFSDSLRRGALLPSSIDEIRIEKSETESPQQSLIMDLVQKAFQGLKG